MMELKGRDGRPYIGQTLLSFFGLLFFSDWFLLAIFYSAGFSGSGGGVLHFFFFFRVHVLGYLFVFVFVFVFVCLSDSRYVIFFSFALESRRVCVRFFFFFLQLFATTNSFFFVTPILIRL